MVTSISISKGIKGRSTRIISFSRFRNSSARIDPRLRKGPVIERIDIEWARNPDKLRLAPPRSTDALDHVLPAPMVTSFINFSSHRPIYYLVRSIYPLSPPPLPPLFRSANVFHRNEILPLLRGIERVEQRFVSKNRRNSNTFLKIILEKLFLTNRKFLGLISMKLETRRLTRRGEKVSCLSETWAGLYMGEDIGGKLWGENPNSRYINRT